MKAISARTRVLDTVAVLIICAAVAEFIAHMSKEWALVSGAPVTFLLLVVMAGTVAFGLSRWAHKTQIDHLKSRLALRDDEAKHGKPRGDSAKHAEDETKSNRRARGKPEAPPPPEQRVFIEPPIAESVGFYREHNEIQANRLMEAYIGKWVKVTGAVGSISDKNPIDHTHFVQIHVPVPGGFVSGAEIVGLTFAEHWGDRLAVLRPGTEVTAQGEIRDAYRLGLNLRFCELVESDAKKSA